MNSSNRRPKWWLLYLIFPLLFALFMLDHRLKTSTLGHEAVQIGIVVIIYGLIARWLKANSSALSRMDRQRYYGRVSVVHIAPPLQSEDKREKHLLRLPGSESKGLLSNTFEMESIDVEALPIDGISQEMEKE